MLLTIHGFDSRRKLSGFYSSLPPHDAMANQQAVFLPNESLYLVVPALNRRFHTYTTESMHAMMSIFVENSPTLYTGVVPKAEKLLPGKTDTP